MPDQSPPGSLADPEGAGASDGATEFNGTPHGSRGLLVMERLGLGVSSRARHGPRTAVAAGDALTSPPAPALDLGRLRWTGAAVIGAQLVCLLVFSAIQFGRYSLTSDFAFYALNFYRMAHGHFSWYFFRNNGEFAFALLTPTYWLWPHGPVLQWEQDLAVVAAELIAFWWICDLVVTRVRRRPLARLIVLSGLVALVCDPWIYWTLAYDFHFETVEVLLALLFARELWAGRRRAWLWAALTLVSSDVAATYVLAISLGALVAGRRWRWSPAIAACSSVLWLAVLHAAGALRGAGNLAPVANLAGQPVGAVPGGSSVTSFARLSLGLLLHPGRLASTLWAQRLNTWANLAGAGLLGVLAPPVLFLALIVVVESSLYGTNFAQPTFQNIPIYLFLPVGGVWFVAWLARRHARTAAVLALVVVLDMLGWGAVWIPRTPGHWIRVSGASAQVLDRFAAAVPAGARVIVSQGIAGRFAADGHPYTALPNSWAPLAGRPVYFVVAPEIGVEIGPVSTAEALVEELAVSPRARPVVVGHGVYGFRYDPPAGQRRFVFPGVPKSLPAWLFSTDSGVAVMTGPPERWRVVGRGTKGYLLFGDYWSEPAGRAVAKAVVAGNGPLSVQVWDVTTGTLLAKRSVELNSGRKETTEIPFRAPSPHVGVFQGVGPFSSRPVPLAADQLEIRVETVRTGASAAVYSVGIS